MRKIRQHNAIRSADEKPREPHFHTYYVGELGVWVHNTNCGGAGDAGITQKVATQDLVPTVKVYDRVASSSQWGRHRIEFPHADTRLWKWRAVSAVYSLPATLAQSSALRNPRSAAVEHWHSCHNALQLQRKLM